MLIVVFDIHDGWVKLAQTKVTWNNKRTLIGHQATRSLSASPADMIASLRRSLPAIKIGRRGGLIVAIPRSAVSVHHLKVPSCDPDEIAQMVELHAEEILPCEREEVVLSHMVTDTDNDGYSWVMLVIAKRSFLMHYLDMLRQTKLFPDIVTLDTLGCFHWYRCFIKKSHCQPAKTDLVIDVDASSLRLVIAVADKCLFTRGVCLSKDATESLPGRILEEAAKTLRGYAREYQMADVHVERIIMTGAREACAGVDSLVRDGMGLPVITEDVFACMDGAQAIPGHHSDAEVSLCSVLGLSMAGQEGFINLLPAEEIKKRLVDARKKQIVYLISLLICLLIGLSGTVSLTLAKKRTRLGMFERQIARLMPSVQRVGEMNRRWALSKKQLEMTGLNLDIIARLYKVIPGGVFLSSVSYVHGDRLVIEGHADTFSQVVGLLDGLRREGVFLDVTAKRITRDVTTHKTFIRFSIECTVR